MAAINIRKLDDLVITLNLTKEFEVRKYLAIKLITLAAYILGGRIEICDIKTDDSSGCINSGN